MRKLETAFVASWCVVMPVTSFLLVPHVQGTTPAFIMAFLSFGLFLGRLKADGLTKTNRQYLSFLVIAAFLWLVLLVGSQIGHIIDDRKNFDGAFLINEEDQKIVFRSALFTQSLYFAACLLIFLYFRLYFRDEWMRYVFLGAYLMAAYGLYEWTYYLIFHKTGDFVANRMYGDHPGSWSQTMDFGGLSLLRIKSFYGEPSFYSSAIILYLMLAINCNRAWLITLLAFNGLFSTSTTLYIGLTACLLFHTIISPNARLVGLLCLLLMISGMIVMDCWYPDTFNGLFGDKISGEGADGQGRVESVLNTEELFSSFSLMNWIFGIGFGVSYNGVSASILANTGIIGFIIYCFAFFKPTLCLPRHGVYGAYKNCVFGLFLVFSLALSELFLPTTWMFLGLAYNKLDEHQRWRYGCGSTARRCSMALRN
jgi:hypothetical protein